jgi:GH15 family glucan-1,4-alpha-glucosidase
VREDRAWLAAGRVPGRTPDERAAAARALLDIRALLQPDGAVAAAWYEIWAYSWPRDTSFIAVALAVTGHLDEARRILGFNARTRLPNGTWQARYLLDGSGVPDARPWQFDSNGWVPWSVWSWWRAGGTRVPVATLWPTVRSACEAVVEDLGPDGLPTTARPDYWENAVQGVTIGEAAPFVAGLRAGADLARATGHHTEASRYARAARRLRAGIADTFGTTGYGRYPWAGSGADSAVTFLAPPFEPYDPALAAAVRVSGAELTIANGGVLPGQNWTGDPSSSWTPETGFFALAAAASHQIADADMWLGWLLAHRTPLGSFPEQVGANGLPQSVAPLGWTDAVYLMALTARDGQIPIPPE